MHLHVTEMQTLDKLNNLTIKRQEKVLQKLQKAESNEESKTVDESSKR